MNRTTLQFRSLIELAAFLESAALINFEINYNSLTLIAELDQESFDRAVHLFHAKVLEQEVIG